MRGIDFAIFIAIGARTRDLAKILYSFRKVKIMSNNNSSSTIIITNITSTTAAPSPYALTWDEQNMLGYFCMGIILVCSIAYVPVLFVSFCQNNR
jgi:uncharacterized membrane protein